jgi:hypothetical protein
MPLSPIVRLFRRSFRCGPYAAGVLAISCFLLASCKTYHPARFNRGLGASGQEILVVPFRESGSKLWYNESARGRAVASAFKAWARENADAVIAEGEGVERVIRQVMDWTNRGGIYGKDWQRLTRALGIKYVLEGDIKHLSTRDPGVIGYYSAKIRASYRVYNAQTGQISWEPPDNTIEVQFGRGDTSEIRITAQFDGEQDIEKLLLVRLGEQIAKDLYGYRER